MKENGVGYGSVNHPVDRDPICGYTGVIDRRSDAMLDPVLFLRPLGVVEPVGGAHQVAGDAADALADIPAILAEIQSDPLLQGVTFSGGEPFCQPAPLCAIARGGLL